jgi:hypothetical protein
MEELRIDPTIAYDVVELPSKGLQYPNKKKSVRVSYLTAADENILSSPNLVATNTVVPELLKRKILDRDLDIEDIVEEDKQAILIFLRNTAFGTEYKMTLTDPKTDKPFTVTVDLSTLKVKDFTLKEDENGEYEYFLKISKVPITFKFLTQKQEMELKTLANSWTDEKTTPPVATKRLEMLIKSVGGSRNQMDIYSFIHNKMPLKDSQDFKKFVNKNKPGLDLTQTIETPSKETIRAEIGFGMEFFRPFYGLQNDPA